MEQKIAMIEDETTIRYSLEMGFADLGYTVEGAETLEAGMRLLYDFQPQVLLLDVRLPDGDGIEKLTEIKEAFPELQIIMMTAYGNTASVVQAMKNGAIDYLSKPFEWDEIEFIVSKTFEHLKLRHQVERYEWETQARNQDKETLIGESRVMQDLLKKAIVAAPTESTVLIHGETGTGKERIAQMIHEESRRAKGPFMALNCGAIPVHLMESELFGYEKGAFTGAGQLKKGLVEWADGGTLFLDEVGEMPLDTQVKLLRFLETRTFKRVGGHLDIKTDIRIVAATNQHLEEAVAQGTFRSDLYYRLHIVPLHVPPLRDRKEDILPLVDYFLHVFAKQLKKHVPVLTDEARQSLLSYHWAGNVRELRNIVERFVILHETGTDVTSFLEGQHTGVPSFKEEKQKLELDLDLLDFDEPFSLKDELERIELGYIKQALEKTKWNVSKSAELLGMSRYALQRRIDKAKLQ
ncbi:sigma-54-dependent transcriptional regulator [Desertibacillus haloalkaliphilus]|uniref:sigma-54-dependent transcriptional regulator n=1 Tax=Desertibacillus haloalkaliphilus TaxID=1328930 RepID=UPI001C2755FB|nr:sigma-54 dependent transcriptional regulator [Desertibacillus haloalkaliphilus]MBU8907543.1 sigma-54 dependent transcriptional regulator [Desertibacillus haloalkaliphilus]